MSPVQADRDGQAAKVLLRRVQDGSMGDPARVKAVRELSDDEVIGIVRNRDCNRDWEL